MSRPARTLSLIGALLGVLAGAFTPPAAGQDAQGGEPALTARSGASIPLDELPFAVSVITGDELRELGVISLADAFRVLPGVDAFALNGFTAAVGVRGVRDEYDPRTQVYLDGRLVNVAEFGGIDWESIPVAIEDIARIEVIRAAGWAGEAGGALQGTIRIFTKPPDEVPRLTYSATTGSHDFVRHYGRYATERGSFGARISAEFVSDDGFAGTAPSGPLTMRTLDDGQRLLRGNAVGVWTLPAGTRWELRLSGVDGRVEETAMDPVSNGRTDTRNIAVATRIERAFEGGARAAISYSHEAFDLAVLDSPLAPLHGAGSDIDLERSTDTLAASLAVPLAERWDAALDSGWKADRLDFERNSPEDDSQEILHGELSTEVRPVERLRLSGGVLAEKDLVTGWDLLPRAGAVLRVSPAATLRAAFRTGRRAPSFTETVLGFVVPNPAPPPATFPLITGAPDLERETIRALELGGRGRVEAWELDVDLQAYRQVIEDLVSFVPDPSSPVPGAMTFANVGEERAQGVEAAIEWRSTRPVSFYANYTWQDVRDEVAERVLRDRPRHKANLGVRWRGGPRGTFAGWSAAANLGYTSEIEQRDAALTLHEIDERLRLDLRVARSLLDDRVEIALIGRNLLDPETLEFRPMLGSNASGEFEAERSVQFQVTVAF